MNIYYDIESPAWKEAGQAASDYGLENHGILNPRKVYWNLPTPALYEEAIFRGEGRMSHLGPLRGSHRQAHRPRPPPTSTSCANRRPRSTSGGASTTGPTIRRTSPAC